MSTGNPPAGYYADPSIPGHIRYWDGTEWVAGTSRPAPEELADQALASSQGNAAPASAAEQTSGQSAGQSAAESSGSWQPEPAATTREQQQAPQPRQSRQYAGGPQQPQQQPQAQPQQQPRQYAQSPATAPTPAPSHAPTPTPVPAPRPDPEPAAAAPQAPESVATMIVPSAFGQGARTGTYKIPNFNGNPFSGLPGSGYGSSHAAADDEAGGGGEATVVELATPGSRFLARIIDVGIAAVFSAPVTATLLLIAHRHDHQYVLKLDAQATSTYTTLGMDALGIAMWAGALLAFVIVSVVYEGYRLGRGGQTFGRKLAGVRVVKLPDGNPLGRGGTGTRRALIFWVLAIIPLVDIAALGGVLWGRPYRQGLHEKATSTVTVKA